MNGHSVIFGHLIQKLEQITPNSSTLQDDQNEWSQCSIWTAGTKVGIFLGFTKSSLVEQGLRMSLLRLNSSDSCHVRQNRSCFT